MGRSFKDQNNYYRNEKRPKWNKRKASRYDYSMDNMDRYNDSGNPSSMRYTGLDGKRGNEDLQDD